MVTLPLLQKSTMILDLVSALVCGFNSSNMHSAHARAPDLYGRTQVPIQGLARQTFDTLILRHQCMDRCLRDSIYTVLGRLGKLCADPSCLPGSLDPSY